MDDKKRRLEDEIKKIEDLTGMPLPKGVCVCESDMKRGQYIIIPTSEFYKLPADEQAMIEESITRISVSMPFMNLRDHCTGNYRKG